MTRRRPVRMLLTLSFGLLLLLTTASVWAAGPWPSDPGGSGGDAGSGRGRTARSPVVQPPFGASLLFHLGLFGATGTHAEGVPDRDASPTLGVTPVIERRFGANFALGGEWMFLWIKDEAVTGDRTKLWCPHLRGRISFPIYPQLEVGALLGIGVGFLFRPEEHDNFSFAFPSYRFGFGGTYALNPQVRATADLGYLSASYQRDEIIAGHPTAGAPPRPPEERRIEWDFHTWLVTLGLTAVF